jgi:UDP-glucose 4-epimerase
VSNARILVTGGSGFIGSSLVKALLRAGCSVRVLDDNSRGRARRLSEVTNDIEFITGDVRDAAAVESAARGKGKPVFDVWGHIQGANVIR